MKTRKSLIALLLALSVLGCTLPASASNEGIAPAFVNCIMCSKSFYVSDEGNATAIIDYVANENTFTQIKITVRFQKQFWGIFWTNMAIDQPNNTWTAYSSKDRNILTGAFPAEGVGVYRAIFYIEVYGMTGAVDVIEDTLYYNFVG